jgi:prepilin-type N-terminal cleavage/methylation domain-containing protein
MRNSSRSGDRGFTLLEVLLAVTILTAVMGSLIAIVTQNISRLTDARTELRVMRLAEEQMREILAASHRGSELDEATTDGVFPEPDDDLQWELVVEEYRVPLEHEDRKIADEVRLSSSFFAGERQGDPLGTSTLQRVELRIYGEDGRQAIEPFVIFTVLGVSLTGAQF